MFCVFATLRDYFTQSRKEANIYFGKKSVMLLTQLHKILVKQRNSFDSFEVIEDSEMLVW